MFFGAQQDVQVAHVEHVENARGKPNNLALVCHVGSFVLSGSSLSPWHSLAKMRGRGRIGCHRAQAMPGVRGLGELRHFSCSQRRRLHTARQISPNAQGISRIDCASSFHLSERPRNLNMSCKDRGIGYKFTRRMTSVGSDCRSESQLVGWQQGAVIGRTWPITGGFIGG